MVGFIKGFFGSNKPREEQPAPPPVKTPAPSQKAEAFFLEMDDARTLGNIDYMRKSKKIRRTFPKTASQPEEKELLMEVSATTMKNASLNGQVEEVNTPESLTPKVDEAAERRRTDTSMDMFRNMAKGIKKP